MSRGRKPKPTNLHKLRGNPSRLNLDARAEREPVPRAEMPTCPEHLDAAARAEWDRVAPELHACGCLTLVDSAALAAYCQSYSRWAKLEAIVQKTGEVIAEMEDDPAKPGKKRPTGKLYPSPYLGALNKALRTMHQFASEFGMTPSSRTRIKVEPPPQEDSFEALLNAPLRSN